jgi:hypothetical protein
MLEAFDRNLLLFYNLFHMFLFFHLKFSRLDAIYFAGTSRILARRMSYTLSESRGEAK